MKSSGLIFWLVVLFVFSGTAMGVLLYRMATRPPEIGSKTVMDPSGGPSLTSGEITEFTLTDTMGDDFNSAVLEGEVWLVSFFFASCPRECPQMNRKIQELQREFGDKGVKFVSITCDPTRDTPGVLSDYAKRFNADPEKWIFLTGDQEYIGRIGPEMFKVPVYDSRMQPAHTNYLTVVDRAGQLHYFNWNEPNEFAKLKTALNEFIAQTPEEALANAEQGEGEDAAQEVEGQEDAEDDTAVVEIEEEAVPVEESTEASATEEPVATP